MAYTKQDETVFTYYDSREEELIEKWLKEKGYSWWRPTVCGDCCGMYENYYAVDGISGKWKSEKDKEDFKKYAFEHGIPFNEQKLDYDEINPRTY